VWSEIWDQDISLIDKKRLQETTYIDERYRQDYFRPGQALFRDYCQEIVERYGLENAVEKSNVLSISYDSPTSLFTVQSSTSVNKARIVVLAIGSGQEPRIPPDTLVWRYFGHFFIHFVSMMFIWEAGLEYQRLKT
jgi:lysine/ornithine N-monooxygenase